MTRGRRASERGLALVSVLWALVILSLIAANAMNVGAVSYRIGRNMEERQAADALAEAAILRAVLGLQDRRPAQRWKADGAANAVQLAGRGVTVRITEEAEKADLNAADRDALADAFRKAGAPDPDSLAERVVERRDEADGAGRFRTIEELKTVAGVTPSLYQAVRRQVTVYSHLTHPMADGSAISPGLGLSAAAEGRAYGVAVEVPYDGGTLTREAVILLTGDYARPFLTLAWR